MAYNGTVDLIAGLRQKNNGTFPLVDAPAVRITDDLRLNTALNNIENSMAAEFDSSSAYAVGNYCIHDAKLYVAKTATAANDGWIAARWQQVTVMGTINDQVGELKTQLSEVSNSIKGITESANTYETIPYKIKQGRQYVLQNKSSNSNIVVNTRATADGSTVDTFGSTGPSSTKTITASADANYLRVLSNKAGAAWKIYELETNIGDIYSELQHFDDTKVGFEELNNNTWLLIDGIKIVSTDSLDDFKTVGNYYCVGGNDLPPDAPENSGFIMKVWKNRSDSTTVEQYIKSITPPFNVYERRYINGAWTPLLKTQNYDLIVEMQAHLDEVYDAKSGITGTANTWETIPYTIRANIQYVIYNNSSDATMTFATRATEDGTNIDTVGPIAPNTHTTFIASNDANYLRTLSTKADTPWEIVRKDTIKNEINELKPVIPIVNLPEKIYAVSGKELNVYFDNIVEHSENYKYNITCSVGFQMARGFQYTPQDSEAGTYTFQLDIIDEKEQIIVSKTASLIVSAASAGNGVTKTFILLGDSTVNGTDTQIVEDFSEDAMAVTSLGTRGTSPNLHEGRTGWTFQYYYNSPSQGGIVNPFYNPTSKVFDADYYFSNSQIDKPDWFFIQLGINDLFLPTTDGAVTPLLNSMITRCDYMISSIKNASPNTKIGIAITIPPNYSQDAFGKAYRCGQTRDRYKRNNMLWVKRILNEYSNKEAQSIYLIPICTNLDTIYNMGLESTPVNARNTSITYQSPIANGGVHPVESGYKQIADVYMAFIKANA